MIQDATLAHTVHYLFEWLALATGFAIYRQQRVSAGQVGVLHATAFPIVLGAILGAGIGNKMVFWLEHPHLLSNYQDNPLALLMGQSIVGGLLGGWIGVEIGKLIAKESSRTGNDFIRPILYGILIGRIGCFLAGLHDGTYGIATRLPWGIDFGDGIKRHPTQIYEWLLACITLITYPRWKNYFIHEAGLSFRLLMLAYLSWRFVSEYLKPLPYEYYLGLGGIQIVCLIAIIIIVLFTFVFKK